MTTTTARIGDADLRVSVTTHAPGDGGLYSVTTRTSGHRRCGGGDDDVTIPTLDERASFRSSCVVNDKENDAYRWLWWRLAERVCRGAWPKLVAEKTGAEQQRRQASDELLIEWPACKSNGASSACEPTTVAHFFAFHRARALPPLADV
ncbi:hypothetical protein MRX96_044829 [Rhipicephalus microplus]